MVVEVSTGQEFNTHGLEKSRRDGIQMDQAISNDPLVRKDRHLIIPATAGQQRVASDR